MLKLCILLLQSLVFNPKIQENPALREIAMLGYGSMVSKFCAELPSCPADVIKVNQYFYHEIVMCESFDCLTFTSHLPSPACP